jgi:methylated-DNA-[protein]-cysteine S-methyltransferase
MNIFRTYYDSPLGLLVLEADKNGITYVRFDAKDNSSNFDPDGFLLQCVRELDEFFSGKRKVFEVRINPQGSDFQVNVWREVYKIPFGKTKSYLDIAKAVGDPNSIRAVGGANGKNKIPIIIPCHRVIGSDGSLTGYGGGMWRKKWLLDFEIPKEQISFF